MKNCLVCTPILPVVSADGNALTGVRPQQTTHLNLDQIAYAISREYFIDATEETWEYLEVVMVDGTHFNVLASDWKRRMA